MKQKCVCVIAPLPAVSIFALVATPADTRSLDILDTRSLDIVDTRPLDTADTRSLDILDIGC